MGIATSKVSLASGPHSNVDQLDQTAVAGAELNASAELPMLPACTPGGSEFLVLNRD